MRSKSELLVCMAGVRGLLTDLVGLIRMRNLRMRCTGWRIFEGCRVGITDAKRGVGQRAFGAYE